MFPNRAEKHLSLSGVEQRLRVALEKAPKQCTSLATRRISSHTLRHTTATHLLEPGVDVTVIAVKLEHEGTTATHLYVEANLAMKEAALRSIDDPNATPLRLKARDRLLAFLEAI